MSIFFTTPWMHDSTSAGKCRYGNATYTGYRVAMLDRMEFTTVRGFISITCDQYTKAFFGSMAGRRSARRAYVSLYD